MTEASHPETRIADALPDHWADRVLPGALRPYARLMRLERPIGWWLLLLPCWWGLALGQIAYGGGVPNPWYALLFLAGAIIMRGAGCTLNDIADRNFDGRVERTRLRPIPAGQVSVRRAFAFLVLLCLLGLVILLQFNWFTVATGAASLLIVAVYPFMKRITYWPQTVLGLAFSWGALMGWAAAFGRLDTPALILYAGSIAWVIGYDTIYAHQDREDDALIGVKSTALLFGDNTKAMLGVFYALAVVLIGIAGTLAGGGIVFALGLAAFAAHLVWQVWRLDIDDPDLCLRIFKSDRDAGLILFAGLLAQAAIG